MFRKLFTGAICTLSIVACTKTIDGVLTNTEVLTFNVKKKTVSIPAGRWEATIKIPSKKEVKLLLDTVSEKKTEISFKVLKSAPLPQDNGKFQLLSKDSGQPYDVNGSVQTTHVDSDLKLGTESCTYRVERQECYYNPHGHPTCHLVYYNYQGWRHVEYFDRETTRVVDFNLVSTADKTRNAGEFSGTDVSHDRIYKYQSECR